MAGALALAACGGEPAPLTMGPADLGVVSASDAGLAALDVGFAPADDAGLLPADDAGLLPADAGALLDGTSGPDLGSALDAAALLDAGAVAEPDASVASPDATVATRCFADIYDPSIPGPNYDQFSPTVGSHCFGTNQQDITGVERVVFLGDSVPV